jgi:hypothetical protein
MNTIAILRAKGLSYTEIMEIIDERQGKQIAEAYNKGFKAGVRGLLGVMTKVVAYSELSNKELSC